MTRMHNTFLEPVSPHSPCGENLEYDPEFLLLFNKTATQSEIQYGDFISSPENINWNDIERETRRLLERTKDMRIMILLLRCRIQLNNAQGLLEGLSGLYQALETWPDNIHPQPITDDENAREESQIMRSNALTSLVDPDGVLSDIRGIVLAGNTALRLQVRDVERALSIPRPADALSTDSVRRQLTELRLRTPDTMTAFDQAAVVVEQLSQWCKTALGEFSPDFSLLQKIISLVQDNGQQAPRKIPQQGSAPTSTHQETVSPESIPAIATEIEVIAATPENDPTTSSFIATQSTQEDVITTRIDALEYIRKVRNWFEINEPSSPIIPLLRQSERLVGKRFSEVINAIPQELLQQWDSEEMDS